MVATHPEVGRPVWELDGPLAQERRCMAALVVTLAEQLYRREHGAPPRSPRDLVGPYLKELPDDDEPGRGNPQ